MAGVVVQTRNPLAPWRDREVTRVSEEVTIADWLEENGVQFHAPTVCIKNGEAIMRDDWRRHTIAHGDIVAFVEMPRGGGRGGSGVLQILMMVVVIVASVFTGGAVGMAYGTTYGALAGSLVMAAGNMLISMLVQPSNGLSNLQNNQLAAPSPTYSVQAQGNSARLGSSIPVIYGLHRVYPDFAAQPYTEYANNEQYLYQLLVIGQGEYDIVDMRIEDSPISSFEEISYTVYGPNQDVTAFPTRVEVSNEVSGQELFTNNPIGHFFANAAGTEINKLGIDIVAPAGMYYANDTGTLDPRAASFIVEAARWNDATESLEPWLTVLSQTISGASNTAIRKTFKIDLTPGRYAVRVTRTNAKDESGRSGNSILWAAMRGYIPGEQNYGGVTLLAMTARATNNLSQTSSRRINCKVQRKLKTWHPDTGWSASAVATRSIVWALADLAKAPYGLKLADSRIDLQGMYEQEQYYQTRNAGFAAGAGDYCDIVFDNKVSAWDAMYNIAQVGRALPILQGAMLRVVRDSPQSIATAMFNSRNIVKGSFSINYMMPGEQTADAIMVEWIDKDTLLPKETLCKLPGSTEANPARVKMQGISHQAQAWREGMMLAAVNRYRRKQITFQTELEGHIPTVGDLIAVSHPMPNWGTSGELVAISGTDLTLSEPVEFQPSGTHYIGLRKPNGALAGPYVCTAHISGDPHKVTLSAALDWTPTVSNDREHTYFAFGPAGEMCMLARVLPPIRPRGANLVELTCVNEHAAVHDADSGSVPALPAPWQLPKKITKPVVARLDVSQAGTAANPILLLSWAPAPNAEHYLVQTSGNNADWLDHPDTTSTSCSVAVEPGPIWVRVAGVGLARGPWATWNGTTGIIPPPGDVTGLASVEAFTGSRAAIKWNPVNRADYYKIEVWAAGVLRRSSTQTATAYAYTAEDVLRDGGPWRGLTFKVWAGNAQGESLASADIPLTNPQEGALSGINVYAGIKSAVITYARPSATDHGGVLVHMDTTSGFAPSGIVPGSGNCVYSGNDATITVPGLAEGTTYYFRLAGFDSFGKDSLTYSGEYSATISSANMPTPEELKNGLQTALNTAVTPLVFDADAFAIRLAGGNKIPFLVGVIEGEPAILLDADVAVTGSLSASQIRTGRIAATENLVIGSGNAVVNGDGSIIVYNGPDTESNRDYALFSSGELSYQRWRDGAYHEYKALKRCEHGTADSGDTVELPGYWETRPIIIPAAAGLGSYRAEHGSQSQTWDIRATNLHEYPAGSGKWRFDAIAELVFADSSGNTMVAAASGDIAVNTWTSGEVNLPANTIAVTATAQFRSVRGNGVSSHGYYYRTVAWTVQGFNGIGWVDIDSKTRNIAAAEHGQQITDTLDATIAAGITKIRLAFVASDTDGNIYTIPPHSDVYDFSTATVASNGASAVAYGFAANVDTGLVPLNGPSYSPPSGKEIYKINYSVTRLHVASSGYMGLSNGLVYGGGSLLFAETLYPVENTVQSPESGAYATLTSGDINTDTYSATFWAARITGTAIEASMHIADMSAVVHLKELQKNSATPSNAFAFQSYAWSVSGSSAITTGTLSWTAIGD